MALSLRYLLAVIAAVGLVCATALAVTADPGPDVVPLLESEDHGDLVELDLNRPIVSLASVPDGTGYWLVASDGGVFAFGSAGFFGSTGALALVSPVVGMASTNSGAGYWLVAADGGVFTFGNAEFHGSAGAIDLARPVVGMASTVTGDGYWLVADDGGVFTYGDAAFHGSAGSIALDAPVVAIAATRTGGGYWLLSADGGVFAFGDAAFHGSAIDASRSQAALAIGAASEGGYWILSGDGRVHTFGPVDHDPAPAASCSSDAVRGGVVTPTGVWLYTSAVEIPAPSYSSSATSIDGASIAEQLSYLQACEPVGTPDPADFSHPFPGSIVSSKFGFRTHPIWGIRILHGGTDVVIPSGTVGLAVRASAAGKVVAVNTRSAYGITVLIDHGDRIATVYAHLSSVSVDVGEEVAAGTTIGGAGATGFVTGAHLHVEVRVNGVPVDPRPLMGL